MADIPNESTKDYFESLYMLTTTANDGNGMVIPISQRGGQGGSDTGDDNDE